MDNSCPRAPLWTTCGSQLDDAPELPDPFDPELELEVLLGVLDEVLAAGVLDLAESPDEEDPESLDELAAAPSLAGLAGPLSGPFFTVPSPLRESVR